MNPKINMKSSAAGVPIFIKAPELNAIAREYISVNEKITARVPETAAN